MSATTLDKSISLEPVDENWHLRAPRRPAERGADEVDVRNLGGPQVGINAESLLDLQDSPADKNIVRVALCDLGIDWMHPALNDRIDYDRARDFDSTLGPDGLGSSDGRIEDQFDAHGTACAGLVCGRHPEWKGPGDSEHFTGVAHGCKLVPIRISTNFEINR